MMDCVSTKAGSFAIGAIYAAAIIMSFTYFDQSILYANLHACDSGMHSALRERAAAVHDRTTYASRAFQST